MILGISAYYHDSAAALLRDGDIVAAAQEERFTRKKHDPRFPEHAIRYCLAEGGIGARRPRPDRLLRQAAREVRAPARDLSQLRAERVPVLRGGDAGVAEGEALPQDHAARRRSPRSATARPASCRNCCSPSITSRTRPPRFSSAPSSTRPCCASTGWASGPRLPPGAARATSSSRSGRSTSRIRSACCIRRSPISPASR